MALRNSLTASLLAALSLTACWVPPLEQGTSNTSTVGTNGTTGPGHTTATSTGTTTGTNTGTTTGDCCSYCPSSLHCDPYWCTCDTSSTTNGTSTGTVNTSTGSTTGSPGSCREVDSSCSSDADCCSGSCDPYYGNCVGCDPVGAYSDFCCSGYSDNSGRCATAPETDTSTGTTTGTRESSTTTGTTSTTSCGGNGTATGSTGGQGSSLSCFAENIDSCGSTSEVNCNVNGCTCLSNGVAIDTIGLPSGNDPCGQAYSICFGNTNGSVGTTNGTTSTTSTTSTTGCSPDFCAQCVARGFQCIGDCGCDESTISTSTGTTGWNGTTGTSSTTGTTGTTGTNGTTGHAGSCTSLVDQSCSSDADCCSGQCDTTYGNCVGCDPDGTYSSYCCSGYADNSGMCTTPPSSNGTSTGTGTNTSGTSGSTTPLVLVFDRKPVVYTDAQNHFELVKPGSGMTTDWPTERTPWLVLDRNGNGSIDDGRELFGSMTVLPDGRVAKNGFEALSALDANHDGVFDARDAAFANVRVWADANRDRRSNKAELKSLTELGVVSIRLGHHDDDQRCDDRGNCEIERAPFTWRDDRGTLHDGEVVDVHLASRTISVAQR